MSVQILIDNGTGAQCLYCTTTDWAFGPIFTEDEEPQEFLDWLVTDARSLTDRELALKLAEWRELPKCIYCDKQAEMVGRTPFKRFCSDECETSYDEARMDMSEAAF